MEIINGKPTQIPDGTNPLDTVNLQQMTSAMSTMSTAMATAMANSSCLWVNGVKQVSCFEACGSGVSNSSGVVSIPLTDISNGNAIFNQVFLQTANGYINDNNKNYAFVFAISTDQKTLTITAKSSVLSLGIIVLNTIPAGVTVFFRIRGN